MNYKKRLTRIKYVLSGLIVFTIFVCSLIFVALRDNTNKENYSRYMLVGKQNIFLVYEDKLAIEIPFDIQLDKEKTIEDLIKVKNYTEILNNINYIFPEKIEDYKVAKVGNIDLKVQNSKKVPEVMVDDKRYILTSSIENLFEDFYNIEEKATIENSKIVVDILNANGKAGYARRTGEKLKKVLGIKCNAANYETNINESYIIINDLNRKQVEDIVMTVDEKYFKLKEDATIPTLANVIMVLGKETDKIYDIELKGKNKEKDIYKRTLEKSGYLGIKSIDTKVSEKGSQIFYNPEDYFVAFKISKKLGIENLKEDKKLKNKIIISVGD
ncbi:LytR C-terminal domain-containing protein [Fusobacterium perfoetens]|uniref:LytR C-terminal domain-containing protein n=1 Tax=Fusobacterium perfoetens TaxID=852 RepID=UPI000687D04C|nr:LytR C-terminal domain-containing protein [Fusobacterium perfoetens]MCI6152999.1 LytR C-terminal domain-containing protein [Fusobacterium perfoetens]MDY3237396.1 LytR C-terminal domain-containing protein [Fusobacterium perfoetens]